MNAERQTTRTNCPSEGSMICLPRFGSWVSKPARAFARRAKSHQNAKGPVAVNPQSYR